jgi:hypothetical protein
MFSVSATSVASSSRLHSRWTGGSLVVLALLASIVALNFFAVAAEPGSDLAPVRGLRRLAQTTTGVEYLQRAKLTAGDGAFQDIFGNSVSIDGDTMVIGAVDGRRQRSQQRVRVRVHAQHGRRPRLRLDAGRQADRGRRRSGA